MNPSPRQVDDELVNLRLIIVLGGAVVLGLLRLAGSIASTMTGATGAESLDSMIESDPRTRDAIWMGVSLALSALADPRVLDAVSPTEDEAFDPTTFLKDNGTLYLLATGAGAGASWPLVAALIEDLVETARHLAARSPGARLDPPLLLALDELGNLAPLPSLPTLMAEGGGTSITTMPILPSLSPARDKWGDNAAHAIWDAAIVKVILGGTAAARDLQDLSTLIGDRDEQTDTITIGDHGTRGLQRGEVSPSELGMSHRPCLTCPETRTLRCCPSTATDGARHLMRTSISESGFEKRAARPGEIHVLPYPAQPAWLYCHQPQNSPEAATVPTGSALGSGLSGSASRATAASLDSEYCDLVAFDTAAERAFDQFRVSDSFVASGYVNEYEATRDGQPVTREEFVAAGSE